MAKLIMYMVAIATVTYFLSYGKAFARHLPQFPAEMPQQQTVWVES